MTPSWWPIRTVLPVALALLAGCGQEDAPVLPDVPVTVATVEQRDVDRHGEYVGELVPAREVALRARTTGFLLEQHVPDGSEVDKGELLFTIEALEAGERRAAAQAQLQAARSQLARAEADVARYSPLLEDEAIARQVYDNAVAARDAARAAVDAQTAVLRQAELALDYAQVRAPLSGRMGAAQLSVGDLVSAGSTLLAVVAADDPLWVYVSLSETEVLELEERLRAAPELSADIGPSVSVTLANGRRVEGPVRIDFRDRALDPVTGTYRVRVVVGNEAGRLLAGQFVRVRILMERTEDALVVSARAVQQVLDQAFVSVVSEDRTLERRPVQLGTRLESAWVVTDGLAPGETIVVDGAQKVRPGMRVAPQPAARD